MISISCYTGDNFPLYNCLQLLDVLAHRDDLIPCFRVYIGNLIMGAIASQETASLHKTQDRLGLGSLPNYCDMVLKSQKKSATMHDKVIVNN